MTVKFGYDIPCCPTGNIIGPITRTVKLYAPNGNVQKTGEIGYDESPDEWAIQAKSELLSDKCGDGRLLSEHPILIKQIYGDGKWSVRIYT